MDNTTDKEQLLVLAALDALDDMEEAEHKEIADYLAAHPETRGETDALRFELSLLAYAVQPVAPSEDLRARLLEKTKETPQTGGATNKSAGAKESGANKPGANKSSTVLAGAQQTASETSNVIPFPTKDFVVFRKRTWAMVSIAAALVVTALITTLFIMSRREQAISDEVARERESRELLTSPDSRIIDLRGGKPAPHADARLAFAPDSKRHALFVYDLPALPVGKKYQMWFIAGKTPVPGATFSVDERGRAVVIGDIPEAARNASTFAITLEPEGGSPQPTSDLYLVSPSA